VLEEAPAPNLTPEVRAAMGEAAVACARAVGYVGAGTVEFLVDSITSDFYFCEMNTRLQVEHPVTEMVTGVDLVEWQLRVASGQTLPLTQQQVLDRVRGCAIEARIYAEAPANDFLPQTGTLTHMQTPDSYWTAGADSGSEAGVRVDSGVGAGDEVSTFYDPMIAKLVAFGEDREEAVDKLARALREFQVAGVGNNVDFLLKCCTHQAFRHEVTTTAFFEHHLAGILGELEAQASAQAMQASGADVLATVALLLRERGALKSLSASDDSGTKTVGAGAGGPFSANADMNNDWRLFGAAHSSVALRPAAKAASETETKGESSEEGVVRVRAVGGGRLVLQASGDGPARTLSLLSATPLGTHSLRLAVELADSALATRISGVVAFSNATAGTGARDTLVDVWLDGQTTSAPAHAQLLSAAPDYGEDAGSSGRPVLKSPMPGKIVKRAVEDGQARVHSL